MIRLRTLVAAAVLTVPVLAVSAAAPADLSTRVMRESPLPTPQTGYCFFWQGQIWCF